MSLTKIDWTNHVNVNQPPERVLADVCKVLGDTQVKLMEENNECIELRRELDEIKRRIR